MPDKNIKKEFEDAIQSGNREGLVSALQKAFVNTIELDIKTTVTNTGPEEIHTIINLLDGDITTTIHSKFLPDPEQAASFHKEQISKGEDIIEKNVNTLKTLAKALIDLL